MSSESQGVKIVLVGGRYFVVPERPGDGTRFNLRGRTFKGDGCYRLDWTLDSTEEPGAFEGHVSRVGDIDDSLPVYEVIETSRSLSE